MIDVDAPPPPPIEPLLLGRRLVAGLLGVAAFAPIAMKHSNEATVWIPMLGLIVGAGIVHAGSFGAQLLARATWWANLLLGMLMVIGESSRWESLWLTIGCALALVVVGHHGLAESRDRRQMPAFFATTLTLAMLFAMADTLTLILFGFLELDDGDPEGALLLICAVAMVIGFVGLYRAKMWGFIANLVTNLAVAAIALSGVAKLDDEMVALLAATAILQLLVAAPVGLVALRRQPLPALLNARQRRFAGQAAIVSMALVAVAVHLTKP
jgi:hypothetical protein